MRVRAIAQVCALIVLLALMVSACSDSSQPSVPALVATSVPPAGRLSPMCSWRIFGAPGVHQGPGARRSLADSAFASAIDAGVPPTTGIAQVDALAYN